MPVNSLAKKRPAPASEGGIPSRALAKGIQIIELLSSSEAPLALGTIAREIRLGKPSTFRLLQTLVGAGVLGTTGDGDYFPIRRFSPMRESTWVDDLIASAREEMERINSDMAEAVSLAALFEDHIRVVHTLESSREIRMSNYLSRILSPYASSLGKAIAAYQSPARLNRLLQVYGVYPITGRTITEPALIFEEMAAIRERGYASEFEETVAGGCCFGAPIRVQDQHVRAAISVSLPTARLTGRLGSSLGDVLKDAASRIEKAFASRHGQGRTKVLARGIGGDLPRFP